LNRKNKQAKKRPYCVAWRFSPHVFCCHFIGIGLEGIIRIGFGSAGRVYKKKLSPARHALEVTSYQTRPKIDAGDVSLLMGSINQTRLGYRVEFGMMYDFPSSLQDMFCWAELELELELGKCPYA